MNLFGYGKTPPWPAEATQSLDDQARLVEAALPHQTGEIYLVGHSFGGSVAMKAAARLSGRVAKLVLLETNPVYLLAQFGRIDAFAEAIEAGQLHQEIRGNGRMGTKAVVLDLVLGCRKAACRFWLEGTAMNPAGRVRCNMWT